MSGHTCVYSVSSLLALNFVQTLSDWSRDLLKGFVFTDDVMFASSYQKYHNSTALTLIYQPLPLLVTPSLFSPVFLGSFGLGLFSPLSS